MIPAPGQCKVERSPEDIVKQLPWGDAILRGQITAVGDVDHNAWIGKTVEFPRNSGNLLNESLETEYWIVKYGDLLEYQEEE
jgi:hypothetical protein